MLLQPNLSAYQKRKHGGKPKTKSTTEDQNEPDEKKSCPKKTIEAITRTTSPLPKLPHDLLAQQKKLDERLSSKRGTVRFDMDNSIKEEKLVVKEDDVLSFIEMVKSNPKIGFLYMSPAVPKSSIEYNPYNLRFVILIFKLC